MEDTISESWRGDTAILGTQPAGQGQGDTSRVGDTGRAGGTKGAPRSHSSGVTTPQPSSASLCVLPRQQPAPHGGDISQTPTGDLGAGGGGGPITRGPPTRAAGAREGTDTHPVPGVPPAEGWGGCSGGVPAHPHHHTRLQNPAVFPRNPPGPLQPAVKAA